MRSNEALRFVWAGKVGNFVDWFDCHLFVRISLGLRQLFTTPTTPLHSGGFCQAFCTTRKPIQTTHAEKSAILSRASLEEKDGKSLLFSFASTSFPTPVPLLHPVLEMQPEIWPFVLVIIANETGGARACVHSHRAVVSDKPDETTCPHAFIFC